MYTCIGVSHVAYVSSIRLESIISNAKMQGREYQSMCRVSAHGSASSVSRSGSGPNGSLSSCSISALYCSLSGAGAPTPSASSTISLQRRASTTKFPWSISLLDDSKCTSAMCRQHIEECRVVDQGFNYVRSSALRGIVVRLASILVGAPVQASLFMCSVTVPLTECTGARTSTGSSAQALALMFYNRRPDGVLRGFEAECLHEKYSQCGHDKQACESLWVPTATLTADTVDRDASACAKRALT